MNPTLSIIIPAYNVCDFIGLALESIQAQTCPPDEIIIIDDGSSDGTLGRVHSFAFDSRVVVVSQHNRGQGPARNLGAQLATSDYLYFFDADDLICVDFVESIKTILNGFRLPDLLLFSGSVIGNSFSPYLRGVTLSTTTPFNVLRHLKDDHRSSSCSPCLYVVKRSFWGEARLSFMPNYFEDEALFYPLILSSSSCCIVDIVLFSRRIRSGSTMTMVLNDKHVQGALDGIVLTSDLLAKEPSSFARQLLAERLLFFIAKYIHVCLKTKRRPLLRLLFGHRLPFLFQLKVAKLLSEGHVFNILKSTYSKMSSFSLPPHPPAQP